MSLRDEILRYLSTQSDVGIAEYVDNAILQAESLSPKNILYESAIKEVTDNCVTLSCGIKLNGSLAVNSLKDCKGTILLTASLTLEGDRLLDTSKSVIQQAVMNATLSAKIEEYLDCLQYDLEQQYSKQGEYLTPRFSPGYYDLPLSVQKEILSITSAEKLLGVRLTENLMLIPVKSVTAIIGIADKPRDIEKHNCARCSKPCIYRKL